MCVPLCSSVFKNAGERDIYAIINCSNTTQSVVLGNGGEKGAIWGENVRIGMWDKEKRVLLVYVYV